MVSTAIIGNVADFESDDSDHEDADLTMQIPGTTFCLFIKKHGNKNCF